MTYFSWSSIKLFYTLLISVAMRAVDGFNFRKFSRLCITRNYSRCLEYLERNNFNSLEWVIDIRNSDTIIITITVITSESLRFNFLIL